MTIRIMKTLGVILAGALLLAACGTKKAPTYNGGGYSSPTTTTTSPSLPIGSPKSPTWVAAKFASINWSSSPKWPSQNYIYTLELHRDGGPPRLHQPNGTVYSERSGSQRDVEARTVARQSHQEDASPFKYPGHLEPSCVERPHL